MKPRIENDKQVIEEIEIRRLRMKELEQCGDASVNSVTNIFYHSFFTHGWDENVQIRYINDGRNVNIERIEDELYG